MTAFSISIVLFHSPHRWSFRLPGYLLFPHGWHICEYHESSERGQPKPFGARLEWPYGKEICALQIYWFLCTCYVFLFYFSPIYFPSSLPFVKNEWRKLIHSWATSSENRAPRRILYNNQLKSGGWRDGMRAHKKIKLFFWMFFACLVELSKSWMLIETSNIPVSETTCSVIIHGASLHCRYLGPI